MIPTYADLVHFQECVLFWIRALLLALGKMLNSCSATKPETSFSFPVAFGPWWLVWLAPWLLHVLGRGHMEELALQAVGERLLQSMRPDLQVTTTICLARTSSCYSWGRRQCRGDDEREDAQCEVITRHAATEVALARRRGQARAPGCLLNSWHDSSLSFDFSSVSNLNLMPSLSQIHFVRNLINSFLWSSPFLVDSFTLGKYYLILKKFMSLTYNLFSDKTKAWSHSCHKTFRELQVESFISYR